MSERLSIEEGAAVKLTARFKVAPEGTVTATATLGSDVITLEVVSGADPLTFIVEAWRPPHPGKWLLRFAAPEPTPGVVKGWVKVNAIPSLP